MRKPIPMDIETEKLVLGEFMADSLSCLEHRDLLAPEDFFEERHGIIYSAILELAKEGRGVDAPMVADRLSRQEQLARVGGAEYLRDLMQDIYTATFFAEHCRVVKGKARLRSIIRTCAQAIERAQSDGDPNEIAAQVRDTFLGIEDSESIESWVLTPEQYAKVLMDRYEVVRETRFRFELLNSYIDCFSPGELLIIGAGGGVGKTGFSWQLAQSIAFMQNEMWAMISMEMSDVALHQRIMSIGAHQRNPQRSRGDLLRIVQEHRREIEWLKKTLDPRQITIPRGGLTIEDLEKAVRIAKRKHNIMTVVVDYLGFLVASHGNSTYEAVSYNVKRCKAIALENQVRFILLSQLNNEGEDGTVPVRLHMFRDSGVIKETADYAIGLWKDVDAAGNTTLLHGRVLKNRTSGIEKKFDLEVRGTYYEDCRL